MKILILCTGNSCRSQMAEGILKSLSKKIRVCSAGTNPASNTHPKAIEVMKELGVDISSQIPKKVDIYSNNSWDYVITVCGGAKENCPVFIGKVKSKLHIGFDDPAEAKGTNEEILEKFRNIRDEILRDFFSFYNKKIKNRNIIRK